MGEAHGHKLHFHGHSVIHRAPAHVKILALLCFMFVVIATPGSLYPLFGLYYGALGSIVIASHVPLVYLLRRMLVELPFVVFALLLPFVADGPRTHLLGLTVSEPGLSAAGLLLAKGTLGVAASLTLAATTEPHLLLGGLERLRVPHQLVQIMSFTIRYLDVVTDELRRMRIALDSRGFRARSIRQWGALAGTASALFVRSYERGERVHLAMMSRGHDPSGGAQ